MQTDSQGLPLSAHSQAAAAAFNDALTGFVAYRADMGRLASAAVKSDPGNVMAHVLKGALAMTAFKAAVLPAVADIHRTAAALAPEVTLREQAHVAALGAWLEHGPDAATRIWGQIIAEHPRDMLAFRLAHFAHFWSGRPERMLADIETVWPAWSDEVPGYAAMLACRCFALEEAGDLEQAEAAGRAAIERDQGEVWAAHGVAHVLEMKGRSAEGVAWLETLSEHWSGVSNIQHHLWWHCALFHLERGNTDDVLRLYDSKIRNLESPLTQAMPDLYIDVQNAVSLLFRLERLGCNVGARWEELASQAEQRIGDTMSTFSIPHWMLALAATGRGSAQTAMIAELEHAADPVVREIALPVSRAIQLRGQGRHSDACDTMRPVLNHMARLGGSHAQQDMLELLFLDCALASGSKADIRLAHRRAQAGRDVSLDTRALWRDSMAFG